MDTKNDFGRFTYWQQITWHSLNLLYLVVSTNLNLPPREKPVSRCESLFKYRPKINKKNHEWFSRLTWNQFHNTAKVEDECFLEAEEKQQSSHSDQHQEGRNSNEKRRGSERIVENGIKSGERPTAHVDSLGVVGVAVLEHTHMAKPRRRGGISNPLWLNEGHEIQNTPNDRE